MKNPLRRFQSKAKTKKGEVSSKATKQSKKASTTSTDRSNVNRVTPEKPKTNTTAAKRPGTSPSIRSPLKGTKAPPPSSTTTPKTPSTTAPKTQLSRRTTPTKLPTSPIRKQPLPNGSRSTSNLSTSPRRTATTQPVKVTPSNKLPTGPRLKGQPATTSARFPTSSPRLVSGTPSARLSTTPNNTQPPRVSPAKLPTSPQRTPSRVTPATASKLPTSPQRTPSRVTPTTASKLPTSPQRTPSRVAPTASTKTTIPKPKTAVIGTRAPWNPKKSTSALSSEQKQAASNKPVKKEETKAGVDALLGKLPPDKNPTVVASKERQSQRIAKAAEALDNAGQASFEKGDFDRAMKSYVKALKLKNRQLLVAREGGDKEEAAQEETGTDTNEILVSVATSINNIGFLRQQSGKASHDETMTAYKKALEIKRRVFSKDNGSVAKTLNNLGTVHYLKKEYPEAQKAYAEALAIMITCLGSDHEDVGTLHSNLGDVYYAQRKKKALDHYRKSLEIRWNKFQDHNDQRVIRLLEKISALEMGLARAQNEALTNDSSHSVDSTRMVLQAGLDGLQGFDDLQDELKHDIHEIESMERRLSIDMIKDRLSLMRNMRSVGQIEDDDTITTALSEFPKLGSSTVKPLSPEERMAALQYVKGRIATIREKRETDDDIVIVAPPTLGSSSTRSILRRYSTASGLLETDSEREIRAERQKFLLLNESEGRGPPSRTTSLSESSATCLEEGINALRTLPVTMVEAKLPVDHPGLSRETSL